MIDRDRFVHVVFQIDTNRINAKNNLPSMNQLEAWHKAGVILIHMSQIANEEAKAGGNAGRSEKATSYIFSMTYGDTADEQAEMRAIERTLFPNGADSRSERNDVEVVFNAKKYGATLVTADGGSKRQPGGILGNRDALRRLGVSVVTDAEAVEIVRKKIDERDARLRAKAASNNLVLPSWIGAD
jgi:hypothetical protein